MKESPIFVGIVGMSKVRAQLGMFLRRNAAFRSVYLTLICITWIISRAPMLNLGYGADADAWDVVYQGYQMAHTGAYRWLRTPGHPLFELLIGQLGQAGWVVTNGLAALAGLGCALLLWQISRQQAGASVITSTAVTLVYSFAPVVWISSTTTMDYVFAELCILASWYLLGQRKDWPAALALGLAVGFRPTSAIFIVGSLGMLWLQSVGPIWPRLRRALRFLAIFLLGAVAAYSPVLLTSRLEFVPEAADRLSLVLMLFQALEVFGALGWAALLLVTILFGYRFVQGGRAKRSADPGVFLAATGLVLNCLLFVFFPDKSAYLLPAVAFALFLLCKLGKAALRPDIKVASIFGALAGVLLVGSLVDLQFSDRNQFGESVVVRPHLAAGFVRSDNDARRRVIQEAQVILTALAFKQPCEILLGAHFPIARMYQQLSVDQPSAVAPAAVNQAGAANCQLASLLTQSQLEELLQQKSTVYYVSGVEASTRITYGYTLSRYPQLVFLSPETIASIADRMNRLPHSFQ